MRSLALLCCAAFALLHRVHGETRTAFEFSRALETCDVNDRTLEGTSRVVYSWNDNDPNPNAEPVHHGPTQRGSQSLNLLAQNPNFDIEDADLKTLDFRMNFTIEEGTTDTRYECKLFKIPDDVQLHVVKYEMIINEASALNVHHALVYECPLAGGHVDSLTDGPEGPCPGAESVDFPPQIAGCRSQSMVYAWAIGGEATTLPPDVGYPIGLTGPSYFLVEIHYDLPGSQALVDNSGVRLTVTTTPRSIELGIMQTGMLSVPAYLSIPPGEPAFVTEGGWCPGEALGPDIAKQPEQKITFFSVFLHAHLAGRQIKLQHFRNGTELKPIAEDKNYDFNLQQYLWFENPVEYRAYDDLLTTCVFDTSDRDEITYGGRSTEDEMCLSFIMYYPRVPEGTACWSGPNPNVTERPYLTYTRHSNSFTQANFSIPSVDVPFSETDTCASAADVSHPKFGSSAPERLDADSLEEWRSSFDYHKTLQTENEGDYELYWTLYEENGTVRFGVDVASSGYVGFGLSPNGGMPGSDVVIAWVDDDTQEVFFTDRMATAKLLPAEDTFNDFFAIRGVQYETSSPAPGNPNQDQDPSPTGAALPSLSSPSLVTAAVTTLASCWCF